MRRELDSNDGVPLLYLEACCALVWLCLLPVTLELLLLVALGATGPARSCRVSQRDLLDVLVFVQVEADLAGLTWPQLHHHAFRMVPFSNRTCPYLIKLKCLLARLCHNILRIDQALAWLPWLVELIRRGLGGGQIFIPRVALRECFQFFL